MEAYSSETSRRFFLVIAAGSLCSLLIVYQHTLILYDQFWSDPVKAYSHGYLTVGMAMFLFYKRISLLQEIVVQPSIAFTPLALLFSALWYIGHYVQVSIVEMALLPAIIWSWVLIVGGRSLAKTVLPAVALFYSAVPIWDMLVVYLQSMAVFATEKFLLLVDIPAYVRGEYIEIPAGLFRVERGCAGLHYLMTGATIGFFYAFVYRFSYVSRVTIVCLAVAFSVVANWVRIIGLVIVGNVTNMEHSLITEGHSLYGWLIFSVVMVVYFVLTRYIGVLPSEAQEAKLFSRLGVKRYASKVSIAFVAIVSVAPLFAWYSSSYTPSSLATPNSFDLERAIPEYIWRPDFNGYDKVEYSSKYFDEYSAQILVLTYQYQLQGKEMISDSNNLSEDNEIKYVDNLTLGEHGQISIHVVSSGRDSRLVFWGYLTRDVYTYSDIQAKLDQLVKRSKAGQKAVFASLLCQSKACNKEIQRLNKNEYSSAVRQMLIEAARE
ncbi:exosortase [Teredinibacter haidensis]|uniref:exosortase n=1 Tax=Teredinibacter haidensis TaxID=2731755 RepID=UPI000948B65A|nr:exosortase [Teredinibacter haidensis]